MVDVLQGSTYCVFWGTVSVHLVWRLVQSALVGVGFPLQQASAMIRGPLGPLARPLEGSGLPLQQASGVEAADVVKALVVTTVVAPAQGRALPAQLALLPVGGGFPLLPASGRARAKAASGRLRRLFMSWLPRCTQSGWTT